MRNAVLLLAVLPALWACPVNAPDLTPIQEEPGAAAAVLLSSVNVADPQAEDQLLDGFHGLENGAWRWTMRRFAVALQPPPPEAAPEPMFLEMRFTVPEIIARRFGGAKIMAKVNGRALAPESFEGQGEFLYSQEVSAAVPGGQPARVEFELENAVPTGEVDQRELGVIVTSIALQVSGPPDKFPAGKRTFPRLLAWLIPPAICLSVYWVGLWCWFHTDDFSLLSLVRLPPNEFWASMIEPRAQGTFRPLSERLFFYLFHGWFGFDAFPFRAAAFATHFANLALLTLLTRQLSGKLGLGVFAASLWTIHHGLAYPLTWSSAFNQILCSFFMLSGLLMFARFAAGGGRGWYWAQLAAFLGGLGSLETAVVYPALCLALGLVQRQKRALWALPLLSVSALFGWLQIAGSSGLRGSIYAISFHPETILANLAWYAREAIAPAQGAPYLLPCGLALTALAALQLWARNRAVQFGLCWFLVTLAPYLVFEGRQAHYYLAIPAAGLAVFLAGALDWKRSCRQLVAAAALFACAVIGWQSLDLGRAVAANNYRFGLSARNLLTGRCACQEIACRQNNPADGRRAVGVLQFRLSRYFPTCKHIRCLSHARREYDCPTAGLPADRSAFRYRPRYAVDGYRGLRGRLQRLASPPARDHVAVPRDAERPPGAARRIAGCARANLMVCRPHPRSARFPWSAQVPAIRSC